MLKDCTVTFPGGRVEALRLDAAAVAAYRAQGARVDTGEGAKAAPRPANKARTPRNKTK